MMDEQAEEFNPKQKKIMWQLLEMGFTNFEANAPLVLIDWDIDTIIDQF